MKTVKFDLNYFLEAVSFALDFVEIDILGATQNHSRRVAYISLRIAEELGLSKPEKSDIISYAILHDNGLCEETLHNSDKIEKMSRIQRIEGLKAHCEFGENNVKHYPFLSNQKNIIMYHHENWDGSGFFGLKGDEIPLLAQIISLADFTDNSYRFEQSRREIITDYIRKNSGIKYSTKIVSAFLEISQHEKFWLDLSIFHIYQALKQYRIPNIHELTWNQILDITRVFASIVDSKSRFTGRHTAGIIEKSGIAADLLNYSRDEKYKFQIAASLHDLGKLAISAQILEKRSNLSIEERHTMKSHTYYTKFALNQIDHFEEIKEWAANHHEKLNGTGYPEGLEAEDLDFNSRLMGCIDIYQALTEDRPYRAGMSFNKAYGIMMRMAAKREIDTEIVLDLIPLLHQKCLEEKEGEGGKAK